MYIITLINRKTGEVYAMEVFASSMMTAECQAKSVSGGDEVLDILYQCQVEGGL